MLRLVDPTLPGATFTDLVAAATAGNVAAQRVLEDAGLHLGWALASVLNLLNPGIVIVGGAMSRAGDLLLEPTRTGLRRHALDSVAQTPIVISQLPVPGRWCEGAVASLGRWRTGRGVRSSRSPRRAGARRR